MDKEFKIVVDMTGKEFVDYQDSRQLTMPKLSKSFKAALPYFALSLCAFAALGFIWGAIFPPEPRPPIGWNGMLMFLTACAGIGWIIHGTGFLLVRR